MTNRMEWQPIETAPKDGRRLLAFAYGPYGVNDVYFSVAQWAMDGPGKIQPHVEGWFWEFAIRPTHWMPLPDAPLVDHPRPTNPVVDHEGGESDPQDALKRESDLFEQAWAVVEANTGRDVYGEEWYDADSLTQGIVSLVERSASTRISELEAEVERLKEENARYERNARTDAKLMAGYHQICTEKGFAPGSRELLEAAARSTAMNKLGEKT